MWGRFVAALSASWRPILAYQTILEFIAMDVVAVHELWTGDLTTLDRMAQFSTILISYFGFKAGLLTVYSAGRSFEKVNDQEGEPR